MHSDCHEEYSLACWTQCSRDRVQGKGQFLLLRKFSLLLASLQMQQANMRRVSYGALRGMPQHAAHALC